MHTYDVALWVVFPSLFPEYVDLMEASHAYTAVQLLMARYGLRWVARAGVRSVSGVPQRWERVWLETEKEKGA
jgi:hypothetical protein